ncbi:Tex family protein [Hydrogenophilus islandicus]
MSSAPYSSIETRIAALVGATPQQVIAAVRLLDEGATVPFIARYRKEVTGGLTDSQLREIETQLIALRALEGRRETILRSLAENGHLTPELEQAVREADNRQRLEDLYLPYRPKRRTKATIAREAGLAPLAETLARPVVAPPETLAQPYVNPEAGVPDVAAALEGARAILSEQLSEEAELLQRLRDRFWREAVVRSRLLDENAPNAAKFRDWFAFEEPIRSIPSHRALALLRGRNEGILTLTVDLPLEEGAPHPFPALIARHAGWDRIDDPATPWRERTATWTWRTKLHPHLERDALTQMRETAEREAIRIFAANLRELLLAPPAGNQVVMGIDPGIRTGIKVAVIDTTGAVVATETCYPFEPKRHLEPTIARLTELIDAHQVTLIAIGNGTASRETERLVDTLLARLPVARRPTKLIVSEAGASIYSASALASEELPDLDVSLRGAVSIARRVQDPLAELVKIDPKSIGVGQYQHDVDQTELARMLDAVVQDCVNAVGVDLNTASPALLAYVAGLNRTLAREIVAWRTQHGPFRSRAQLLEVPRLGPKTFEQCAGFLRIRDGVEPLDASAVHPEAYPLVEKILARIQKTVREVMGRDDWQHLVNPNEFTDERFGLFTVQDLLEELAKPGRDPRGTFQTVRYREGVETLDDLHEGMWLEGVVTNVTHFGAFVDIGVHQDGLVHVSELADRFVKDPLTVVKPGQIVKVRVIGVDKTRNRIALSLRGEAAATSPAQKETNRRTSPSEKTSQRPVARSQKPSVPRRDTPATALALALARAKEKSTR